MTTAERESMTSAERGFTLLELLVCVFLLAIVGAATAGAFAAVARNAASGQTRAVALMVAENALARARAVTAYAQSGDPSAVGAMTTDRSWALVPGTQMFSAGAELRAPAQCGTNTSLRLTLPVTTAYDPAQQAFSVTVGYPSAPCSAQADRSLTLRTVLPPSVYAPGQGVALPVNVPARM
jgi:prepilin-type N-terminal cleavage/methylation domain-containing protein